MSFSNVLDTLIGKLETTMSSKTVVGEPIQVGEKTIIPITKLSFGFGAGGQSKKKDSDFGGGSGGGATIEPAGFIVISGDSVNFLPVKLKESVYDKLLDVKTYEKIGELIDKFKGENTKNENIKLEDQ